LGHSSSSLVNAATWGLMLTGRVLDQRPGPAAALRGLVRRVGEPVVRTAVARAMRLMGSHFVLGETIEAAMSRARSLEAKGYTYSYDMLGEAARTDADARRYAEAYGRAIAAIARAATGDVRTSPGISVKLSALHPRYEWAKRDTVMAELVPRARDLARAAARARIGFNIDAEEAERLDLSLDVIEALLADPELAGWDGFGVVVQAYGRRAMPVIEWLDALATRLDRRLMVRLVKGAYWDTEIKQAQERGLESFPVFTRKVSTDASYIACARRLLEARPRLYPQFATHNAHTAMAVLAMAGDRDSFEFQRLHGMGESLHELLREMHFTRCRIYAPVGAHRDLLAYLVRRLLENGANSSFVNQLVDEDVPPEVIAADPLAAAERLDPVANPGIRPPRALFDAAPELPRLERQRARLDRALPRRPRRLPHDHLGRRPPHRRPRRRGRGAPRRQPGRPRRHRRPRRRGHARGRRRRARRRPRRPRRLVGHARPPTAPPRCAAPPTSTRPTSPSSARSPPARPARR
jgi:RHH-type transcriptional regulator, proline utilization regulon repressor / proline dehydrogenase / delta 1-pyrroline-5-carboxylate dehydrogenase